MDSVSDGNYRWTSGKPCDQGHGLRKADIEVMSWGLGKGEGRYPTRGGTTFEANPEDYETCSCGLAIQKSEGLMR